MDGCSVYSCTHEILTVYAYVCMYLCMCVCMQCSVMQCNVL